MGIETTLKRAEAFLGLDDSSLARIAALPSSHEVIYEAGATVFKAGSTAHDLYILKEGQVDLVVTVPSGNSQTTEMVVDTINTGSLFGWSALVGPHVYSLAAVCRRTSTAVVISGRELTALFDQDYYLGYKVFQSLTHIIGTRLRDVERVLITGKRWPFI